MSAHLSELGLPHGACDCHLHFFPSNLVSREHPSGGKIRPSWVADYKRVSATLGLSRLVAVQSTMFKFDNLNMVEAMSHFKDRCRGIAVIPVDTNNAQLRELHSLGIRGVRAVMLNDPLYTWGDLHVIARRIAPLRWHLQLQIDGRSIPSVMGHLEALACDLVIDHIGKFLEPVRPDHHAFQAILRLLDSGTVWVKLSAPYETSRSGPPDYEDVSLLATRLVNHRSDRLVWGTNFPHPGIEKPPTETQLIGLLKEWAPDPSKQHAILVENPQILYDFDKFEPNCSASG